MVKRKKDNPRSGKLQRDANLREHPAREHASRTQSVTPPIAGGVQTSASLPKHPNEIDDYKAGAKALALGNGSVPQAIIGMCKIGDLTYLTLDAERSALEVLMRAWGTKEPDFLHGLLHQVASAGSKGEYADEQGVKFMLAAVQGIEPRDQLEAMLAAQMVATHVAMMRFANRLGHSETPQETDSAERTLNKLARTFAAQVEALQRYRAGKEDRVIMHQNVSVCDGGQAIVGNVTHPSRRPRLKKRMGVTPGAADSRQRPVKGLDERQRAPVPLPRGRQG